MQEVKPDFEIDKKHKIVMIPGQKKSCDLRIYASQNLKQFCIKCDSYERYQVLKTKNGQFVNVHMPSSWRTEDKARMKYYEIAKNIRTKNDFDLIGGDINSNPFELVTVSSIAWFAKKSIDDFTQKKDEGLLNPFWRVWNTDMDGDAKGSFPGCNDDFSRRQILDQFFVSPLKFKNVTDCGVLDHLFGESFDTINKKKEVTSTKGRGKLHWPVYIKYKVGEYYV
ncbi:hypothetical protein [Fibrobacter sp. UWH1]|uniref:hypothetical protein n=1 Tax=Fibrobacter sp. UWH1 TaxID=1964354 RepID=UPI000B524661|nr:hypothetical protein [Fibrobacter sp. UWH1]OWV06597.1 hypothetical protein B7992_14780 [Fibrobacter sp. UWH1]